MIDVFPIDFLISMVFYWAGHIVRNSNICHHTILSGRYIVRKSNIYHHTFLLQNLTLKRVKPNERNK